jgi:type IV secretory pathway ATPase VirB11/archaellum biosynthesis ATPase
VQILNEPWPWWGTLRGRPLAIADLLARSTLTAQMAAVLWWTIQHGASVFVAAGPPGAGKSTLANALLEFLPDDAQLYVTSGAWDRLQIPPAEGPVYLLINELSAHMPVYLSGPAATLAFDRLRSGVRMLGTLHARSAAEALRVMSHEAEIQLDTLSTPFVFAVIVAHWQGQHIVRRVIELGFLPPHGELIALTHDGQPGCLCLEPAGLRTLADWSGNSAADVESQIADRIARTPVA